MAMGGNVTHCGKQIASWVRIPITTPSLRSNGEGGCPV